ncbi:hypothetical protein F2P81_018055 [Scophthalmus maximus]|uniref:Uncharacterized protein n=1 Tax=Scophthalmus maximus TaxID=52904 RepID=A0A6A4SB76_SCOMX|nr:hypothetical protein F2P81_018055 [Scophthalmus maximus]
MNVSFFNRRTSSRTRRDRVDLVQLHEPTALREEELPPGHGETGSTSSSFTNLRLSEKVYLHSDLLVDLQTVGLIFFTLVVGRRATLLGRRALTSLCLAAVPIHGHCAIL